MFSVMTQILWDVQTAGIISQRAYVR